MKADIASAASNAHAITTDAWTSLAVEGYITTTIHFISPADYTLQARVLDTNRVAEDHTAENLNKELGVVIKEWGIKTDGLAIITDNAANIVKACQLGEYSHVGCFAHTLNLAVGKGTAIPEVSRVIGKCRQIVAFFNHSDKKNLQLQSAQEDLELQVRTV